MTRLIAMIAAGLIWCGDAGGADEAQGPLAGTMVSVQLDLSEDDGRNIGTLFELTNADGRAIAGAGVVSVSNANIRGDRMQLNVYVRPPAKETQIQMTRLPRPNDDASACIFTLNGRLYSFSYRDRNADRAFRLFNPEANQWQVDESIRGAGVLVRGKFLESSSNATFYDGQRSFYRNYYKHGGFGLFYFAGGHLIMQQYKIPGGGPSRIIACPWTPGQTDDIDPARGITIELSDENEFPYCYGQLDSAVLVGTSRGGLHAFDGATWRTIVPASDNKSSQFYSIINYEDRLLLGHYPSGLLWSWDGANLRQMDGWPPTAPGAAKREREAQTMFIHGGELFVGVWPWGELWRMNRDDESWQFVTRLFDHPPIDANLPSPYARESEAAGDTYNRWGQRVMSMATLGDSLYVSTSAKNAEPWDESISFLGDGRWQDYGAVLRIRTGVNLAVPMRFKAEPTQIQVRFQHDKIVALQDGEVLGELTIEPDVLNDLRIGDARIGTGIYGRCAFPISNLRFSREPEQ